MIAFNGELHIREQIQTILTQSPPPDELVIGDDGSTDATLDLIRELAAESAVPFRLIGGDHVGLRLNMQRTIEACSGEVIVLSDQDDVWLPGKIAAIRGAFADPEVTLWFSDAEIVDESGEPLGDRLWDKVTLPPDQQNLIMRGGGLQRLLFGQTVSGATMAFRSTLKPLVLPLPAELELGDHIYLHDGWIVVLAFLVGRSIVDPTTFVRYRQHPRQVTGTVATARFGAINRLGIASSEALRVEWARTHLVLGRLIDRGVLSQCRAEDRRLLTDLETFQRGRVLPPGPARVRAILRELAVGSYSRYARGLRTAAGDLLLPRGTRATRALGESEVSGAPRSRRTTVD